MPTKHIVQIERQRVSLANLTGEHFAYTAPTAKVSNSRSVLARREAAAGCGRRSYFDSVEVPEARAVDSLVMPVGLRSSSRNAAVEAPEIHSW